MFREPIVTKREIASEREFVDAVRRERKRCDRGDASMLLVLLRTTEKTDASLREMASHWTDQARETDYLGWHHASHVLGILITDVRRSERKVAEASVRRRLENLIEENFGGSTGRISSSLHFYPQDYDDELPLRAGDPFYRDLVSHDETLRGELAVKRVMDIAIAVTAMVLLAPLLLLIAVAVKMSSPGPVLFRQTRVGQNGRLFTLLKIRSMHADADGSLHQHFVTRLIRGDVGSSAGGRIYKISSDPRMTAVGRRLRRTSLDELPQLWNVLKGDMSIVGPRPPVPYELEQYNRWHLARVLEAKPGITGLWQVTGRSRVTFDDMVRLDLRYAHEWSLWLDFKILARTSLAVLSGAGAY